MQGQKVQSGSFEQGGKRNSINVSGNSPGLYMLDVKTNEQRWVQKIVVE